MIVNEETVVSILKTVKYLCKWLSTKNLSGCLAVQPPTQDVPGRNIIIATLPKIILTLVLWVDYITKTHFPSGRLSGTIKVSTTATGPHLEGWLPGNMLHLFLVVLFLSFQVWPSSKNTEHATVITSYRDNHLQWLPSTVITTYISVPEQIPLWAPSWHGGSKDGSGVSSQEVQSLPGVPGPRIMRAMRMMLEKWWWWCWCRWCWWCRWWEGG